MTAAGLGAAENLQGSANKESATAPDCQCCTSRTLSSLKQLRATIISPIKSAYEMETGEKGSEAMRAKGETSVDAGPWLVLFTPLARSGGIAAVSAQAQR